MQFKIQPLLYADGYKVDHRRQYPANTQFVNVNFTPRKSRMDGVDHMVFFGLQGLLKRYTLEFEQNFFKRPKAEVCGEYQRVVGHYMGDPNFNVGHIESLHDLGYLPLRIKALEEGTKVPLQTPCMTMENTHPEFFWLPNYLETLFSAALWKPCTSATIAGEFRNIFDGYAELTGADETFLDFQGHDFSFRGMSGTEDAMASGAAHLLYFYGTDTIPALRWLEHYYDANIENTLVGCSVPATEHSVMCAGGQEDELGTLRRLLKLYPEGIVSVVADTWDLFKLITEYLPILKDEIMARPGKLVIRPDSGVPNKIINGDPESTCPLERKGVIRLLDEIFGHTTTSKGFKKLDSHIGVIYGDGINREELHRILSGMMDNGYSSDNIVIGLGSYTYQYVTRDTFGTVCKATWCQIDGRDQDIFKSPKTGAWKKSHRGLLRVNDDLSVTQECTRDEHEQGLLKEVYFNGKLTRETTLSDIRRKVGTYA